MQKFQTWFQNSTVLERKTLMEKAKISPSSFYKLIKGERQPSAEVAGRLELALDEIEKGSKGRLPVVTRADLCTACANCPYAQKCLKK